MRDFFGKMSPQSVISQKEEGRRKKREGRRKKEE
jgi:hypothetical protein